MIVSAKAPIIHPTKDVYKRQASSHIGSAEKQFRFPLEYGNQRPLSATWTVTGSGGFIVSKEIGPVKIQGITTGKIVDYGMEDPMNMGAVSYTHLDVYKRQQHGIVHHQHLSKKQIMLVSYVFQQHSVHTKVKH